MATRTDITLQLRSTSALVKQHKFDYDSARNKFFKMCLSYRKNTRDLPRTNEQIEATIRKIQEGKSDVLTMNVLKVTESNGKNILIHRTRAQGDRKIISMEEAFDLMVEAHFSNDHLRVSGMWKKLNNRYFFPRNWLCTFIQFCECSIKFNEVIHLDILSTDITNHFDGNFKHVLLYVDKATKFVLLRPLTSQSENELTVEILKIFTDFNVPRSIEVYSHYYILFDSVFANMKNVLEGFSSRITTTPRKKRDKRVTTQVKCELQQWIDTNKCNNWAIGCHIVQHRLNNMNLMKESPYDSVFKGPTISVASARSPSHVQTESNSEEKVQNVNTDSQDTSDEEDFVLLFEDDDEDAKPNAVEVDMDENNITEETCNSKLTTTQLENVYQITIEDDSIEMIETEMSGNGNKNVAEQAKSQNDVRKNLDGCCCECSKFITTTSYYCCTCKRIVHLLCGHRVVKIVDSRAGVKILCKLCFKLDTDANEQKINI